ncbi:hypothetical protein HY988_05750 [Candidatus Micrarchaeota archaeon]|nr:hypothetical protein [Candidatus Micrarchaeota archaeon]
MENNRESEVYSQLNKEWKTTCRILLGEEIGELNDYEEWLNEYKPKAGKRNSAISGNKVMLCSDIYNAKANFVSAKELREGKPLTINEVKDIDSIIEAVKEKWVYVGDRILGHSKFVESSDLVIDSHYVENSINITQSSNISDSFLIRLDSKNIFGSGFFGKAEFVIKLFAGFNIKRVFESYSVDDSSDMYFSHACIGCSEMLFSFFQRNKRHTIGNLQLGKEKYFELKKKLLAEAVSELKKSKSFPSLFKLSPTGVENVPEISLPKYSESPTDLEAIERAFSNTYKVILKKESKRMMEYQSFLSRHMIEPKQTKSVFGDTTYYVDYGEAEAFSRVPKSRMVSVREGVELGKLKLKEEDITSISKITSKLGDIAYFTIEILNGNNSNVIESPLVTHSNHVFRTFDVTHSKYTGITSQALNSSYIFGGNRVLNSDFAINCYNSLYLSRCFEVDTSTKCSDSLFLHNCEGNSETIFCFNVKGKHHAIGNLNLEQGTYTKIKDSLLEQISNELDRTKTCSLDIFTIGGRK